MQARLDQNGFGALIADRRSVPAIDLLARTAAALRADPDFMVREEDVAAGLLLADEAPTALAPTALEHALARIDADEASERRALEQLADQPERAEELAGLPAPLREAALDALRERSWSFAGFGVRRLGLFSAEGAAAELVRVEPGFGAAEHDHEGEELTLVVTGAYQDGQGQYRPGDIARALPGFKHAPRAEMAGVCYLLLVSYGAPKFTGRIGLLQRTTGFPWAPKLGRPN